MYTANVTANISEEQMSRFTGYPVTLPLFEGPLDLLLYLIKRQEIDITDIPIAKITAQFLDYVGLLQQFDMELASGFLVLAAELLEIKSRMLLPRPPAFTEDEVEEEDPRAELVRKLVEYQQYKAAAGELELRAEERKRLFSRSEIVPNLSFMRPDPELAGNPDAFSLWSALQEVLARVEAAEPQVREVARARITIRQQVVNILKRLEASPSGVAFVDFFLSPGGGLPTRLEVIVTFLAMLELMRMHRILVVQEELFGPISIIPVHPSAHLTVD